jgi:hypothetical protein
MNKTKAAPLKIRSASKRKPTKHAKEEAAILAELGLKLHRSALSRLYCKPSRAEWLDTPAEDKIAYAVIVVMQPPDGDAGTEEVQLTREEHIELKDHLAFLRRIRRPDPKAKEASK